MERIPQMVTTVKLTRYKTLRGRDLKITVVQVDVHTGVHVCATYMYMYACTYNAYTCTCSITDSTRPLSCVFVHCLIANV